MAKGGAVADEEIEKLGWTVGKTLGEGAFGLVKYVTRKEDGMNAACKIIAKPKTEKEMKTVEMEYHVRGARARGAARGAASAEAPHAPMMQTRAASRGVLTLCCGRVPTRRS